MDGYYVEWISKKKNIAASDPSATDARGLRDLKSEEQRMADKISDSSFSENQTLAAENNSSAKNILIEKPKYKVQQMVFIADTLVQNNINVSKSKKEISVPLKMLIVGLCSLAIGFALAIFLTFQVQYLLALFVMAIFIPTGVVLIFASLIGFIVEAFKKRKERNKKG